MSVVLACTVALGIALPHALPLVRVSPAAAATVCCAALALRAVIVVYVVLYTALFLPHTELFSALTHWCWETILPLLATHLGLDGTHVGGGTVVLPAAVLAASLITALWGLVVAGRALRSALRDGSLGSGPRGSVIVGGGDVVLASAGLTHPRILISAGALTMLEDDELAAALEHECGHIAHRHRFVLLFSELCRAVARFLPGTRRAVEELRFHLERDADRWALARRHDPYALAAAILKASQDHLSKDAGVAALAGGDVARRLNELLGGDGVGRGRLLTASATLTAVLLSCFAVGLGATMPGAAAAGLERLGDGTHRHCVH